MTQPESDEREPAKTSRKKLRIILLLVLLGALVAVGKLTGVADNLDKEALQRLIDNAGIWAVPVFIGVFALGELIHIPGFVFVAGAVAAYDQLFAYVLSLAGAICSATVSFVLVRGVAGKALSEINSAFVQRLLSQVDRRPLLMVVILRSIFWMAPPLNYALALTRIRFRDYLIGTALGLVLPVLLVVFFFDWLFQQDLGPLIREYWPFLALVLAMTTLAFLIWRRWATRHRSTDDDKQPSGDYDGRTDDDARGDDSN